MKKIFLTIALCTGAFVAMNAQSTAAGSDPNAAGQQKPKTVVEQAGTATTGTTTATAADSASTNAAKKKPAKKSCCKKGAEGTPCDKAGPSGKAKTEGIKPKE
jgi:hypothetical protein